MRDPCGVGDMEGPVRPGDVAAQIGGTDELDSGGA